MACQAIHSWTFSGLVGAFLDLAIAYLLLSASTIAFFASKFLDFLGLFLPCPFNGLFGNANSNYWLKRQLIDCPIETVSCSTILHGILQNINGSIHRTMLRLLLIRFMTMLLCVKSESSYEEIKSSVQKELGYEGNEKNAIRILEQALEEEHAARAALYLEVEKERSAAATAADEAMSIIPHLQDEKVSIEMEAWQYQRIIEEKSTCDAEEMNICKEILVRRQKEKHFLEREVEAYRLMIHIGNQQLQDDIQ
ncbi:uncharacterized protein LOC114283377 [Camellia sinensis]|uniref:uncharacterized protein LOC114283377 n=1 Tax=Camellia sinensis TaxID=4442 RepID=UPI001035BEAA|nr:uncharacterized protein LOC114283377 [Camellia sinensis]